MGRTGRRALTTNHLSTPGLAAALAVVVFVHVLSETITLSRLIDGAAPLR